MFEERSQIEAVKTECIGTPRITEYLPVRRTTIGNRFAPLVTTAKGKDML
jgi:hypothetical protein